MGNKSSRNCRHPSLLGATIVTDFPLASEVDVCSYGKSSLPCLLLACACERWREVAMLRHDLRGRFYRR